MLDTIKSVIDMDMCKYLAPPRAKAAKPKFRGPKKLNPRSPNIPITV